MTTKDIGDVGERAAERFLKKNGTITNADVRQMFNVSSATANRILAKLTDEGKLEKIRIGRSWGYSLLPC